jgi:hypothetical protein
MQELLAFKAADGNRIVVEISQDDPGFHLIAASGKKVPDASTALEAALRVLRSTITVVAAEMASVELPNTRPGEIVVEFGLKFSSEVGVFLTKAAGEAHLNVTMKWTHD